MMSIFEIKLETDIEWIVKLEKYAIIGYYLCLWQQALQCYKLWLKKFSCSVVGYVLNNNFKNRKNDQTWLQVRLLVQKHAKWKKKKEKVLDCQNFDVTVLPLIIGKFLRESKFIRRLPNTYCTSLTCFSWIQLYIIQLKVSQWWAAIAYYSIWCTEQLLKTGSH